MTSLPNANALKATPLVQKPENGSLSGTIFSTIRFSTHDGPGIRTTVFMKGCPLSCWWCHNPENWQHMPSEIYRPERCIGCGVCIAGCPSGALSLGPQGVSTDSGLCRHCGRCADICPSEARERTSRNIGVADLVSSISRDAPFYDQSGGGVTFSGGEPLCQPDFLIAALKRCGELEIHRAVDTSGFADSGVVLAVARHTDLFLYDLKLIDSEKHLAHTGVDNSRILANLRILSDSGAAIIVRIPLISGVNDDSESLTRAGEFIAGLPCRHSVDLLPFHRAANAKYAKLGLGYRGEDLAPPSPECVAAAAHQLSDFGLKVRIGG
jgi:pyruvate formate lyase activating enzyme